MHHFHEAAIFASWLTAVAAVACGARPLPGSVPHEMLGEMVPRVNPPLRIEAAPPAETFAVPQPGRVTVVEFWATWCAACRARLADLEDLWGRVDKSHVAFVGVAIDESAETVRDIAPSLGVTFPMVYDSAGALDEGYRVGRRVPATFVVDPVGRVRFFAEATSGDGATGGRMAELERAIAAIAAESR